MPLREFIAELEDNNELQRIVAKVNPDQELAAITDRICKSADGGPALFFADVSSYPFPIAINLFGSAQRIALALGTPSLKSFGQRILESLRSASGQTAGARLQSFLNADNLHPVSGANPHCREVIAKTDLSLIPALKSWPQETIPSLTLPLVFTIDPVTGQQNCGMYRVQIHGPDYATVNFSTTSGGMKHLAAWRERNEPMPVAIALGGDPALIWAAGAPLPRGCDELHMAAWASGRTQTITAGLTQPLQVPAAAEFVIEGVIHPGETKAEGAFGNHTGGYVSNPSAALLRVTSLSHRRDAICPATLVGPPPMEDCWLARASEQLLLAMLQIDHPQVVDLHLPLETIFHGCALVAVEGINPGEGIELLHDLREESSFKGSKLLILLDADIDIRNCSLAYWRTINLLREDRILTDGGRIAIDATGIDPAQLVASDRETQELISRRWDEYFRS